MSGTPLFTGNMNGFDTVIELLESHDTVSIVQVKKQGDLLENQHGKVDHVVLEVHALQALFGGPSITEGTC